MSTQEDVYKAVDLVAAYAAHNFIEKGDLTRLVEDLSLKISSLIDGPETSPGLVPAVPIEDSVKDDHIVCLEDGQKVTLLKRYLRRHFNLSPEEYREKWGLPEDYPMVTKKYSQMRSKIAKAQGLGKN